MRGEEDERGRGETPENGAGSVIDTYFGKFAEYRQTSRAREHTRCCSPAFCTWCVSFLFFYCAAIFVLRNREERRGTAGGGDAVSVVYRDVFMCWRVYTRVQEGKV